MRVRGGGEDKESESREFHGPELRARRHDAGWEARPSQQPVARETTDKTTDRKYPFKNVHSVCAPVSVK